VSERLSVGIRTAAVDLHHLTALVGLRSYLPRSLLHPTAHCVLTPVHSESVIQSLKMRSSEIHFASGQAIKTCRRRLPRISMLWRMGPSRRLLTTLLTHMYHAIVSCQCYAYITLVLDASGCLVHVGGADGDGVERKRKNRPGVWGRALPPFSPSSSLWERSWK
jgi:hypothetical protein